MNLIEIIADLITFAQNIYKTAFSIKIYYFGDQTHVSLHIVTTKYFLLYKSRFWSTKLYKTFTKLLLQSHRNFITGEGRVGVTNIFLSILHSHNNRYLVGHILLLPLWANTLFRINICIFQSSSLQTRARGPNPAHDR